MIIPNVHVMFIINKIAFCIGLLLLLVIVVLASREAFVFEVVCEIDVLVSYPRVTDEYNRFVCQTVVISTMPVVLN